MNRKGLIKGVIAVAGAAVLSRFAFATEGGKKMKTAVVYYSWSGNTRFAAETIAKKAGADIFEIKSSVPALEAFASERMSSSMQSLTRRCGGAE